MGDGFGGYRDGAGNMSVFIRELLDHLSGHLSIQFEALGCRYPVVLWDWRESSHKAYSEMKRCRFRWPLRYVYVGTPYLAVVEYHRPNVKERHQCL